jgi:hypothetical protein
MMHYNTLLLKVECKNKKSIFYLSLYLTKMFDNLLIKHKSGLKSTLKFSILRSPHVHKSSQHEFRQRVFKKQFVFYIFNSDVLVYLKKLFLNFFHDIKKSLVFILNHKSAVLNIKLFTMNLLKENSGFISALKINKKLKNFLKIINFIGKCTISYLKPIDIKCLFNSCMTKYY